MGSSVNINWNFGMIVLETAIGNDGSVVELTDAVSCNMTPDLAERALNEFDVLLFCHFGYFFVI